MKRHLGKTALFICLLMLAELFTCAFAYADDSYMPAAESVALDAEASSGSMAESDTENTTPEPEDPDPQEEETNVRNGWIEKNGKKYYFINDVKQTGMTRIGKSWYYFNVPGGSMKKGWLKLKGDKYFFSLKTGRRLSGKELIDGGVYYFSTKTGKMIRGWLKKNGKRYYHSKKTGKRLFGSRKIGKFRYFFNLKSGSMKKGWLKRKGKKYYYNKKGHKLFGIQKIGKKTYFLNKTTGAKMSKGSYYLYRKIWTKSSSTKYLIYVDKGGRWVNVFKGKRKNWDLIRRCRCTIGKPSTPTPSGTYRVVCKVLHFGESKGYTCWYATGFIGSTYLMHSVVCYSGTKTPSDGRLGAAVSHGCVRMHISKAKWIYDNIPGGSTVYIS